MVLHSLPERELSSSTLVSKCPGSHLGHEGTLELKNEKQGHGSGYWVTKMKNLDDYVVF